VKENAMQDQVVSGIRLPRSVSRRDLVRASIAGAGLVALGPLTRLLPTASGAPQPLKRLVIVNCYGGNDTLNMFVPVNLTPYYARRTGLALQASQCLSLASGPHATSAYMLHPSMPKLAALWAGGEVAAVNRVGYPTADLSHFVSQDIYSLGVRGGFAPLGIAQSGWIARFCDRYAPTPLGAVAVNVGRPLDLVGGATSPLPVSSLANFKLQGAGAGGTQYTPAHFHRLATAKKALDSFAGVGRPASQKQALTDAHALTDQVQAAIAGYSSTTTYANERLSNQMKDLATVIQGGFESRILYTGFSGFDTHSAQGTTSGAQATLLAQLDNAIGSFATDLKAMGVWSDVVIAVITEFGRRNYVNGSVGTDHGHAYTMLLTGGAVQGGVFGPDLVDADLNSEYPSYAVDFRSIYKEIVRDHMGLDPTPVFPETVPIDATLGVV
jgi:uncharacterized protein (DUF1501 family)